MRYLRQVIFENIGERRQKLLEKSRVTVVGLGALGTNVCDMLVRSGVKNLKIIDRDFVELSNLQRQSLYTENDLDNLKVLAAEEMLKKINNKVLIESYNVDLDFNNVDLLKSELVLDCTDNFYTRFLINDYCVKNSMPWICASVVGSRGMCFNIIPKGPCLRCWVKEPDVMVGTCDTEGILNTIAHGLAAIQVTEAIKILTKQKPNKDLVHYDIWRNKLSNIKIKKNENCLACNGNYEYLNGRCSDDIVKICGSNSFQIKTKKVNLNDLSSRLKKLGDVKLTSHCLFFKDLVVFKSGRALIKAESKEEAKSKLNKYLG